MRTIILLSFIGYCALACTGCDQYRTYDCGPVDPVLITYGYDSTEIDSIVVTAFEKGSAFSKRIADTLFTSAKSHYSRIGRDSFYVYVHPVFGGMRIEDYDWRYTVLSDSGKTDVSNIVRPRKTVKAKSEAYAICMSLITELTVNGSDIKDGYGMDYIVIKKP
jgi:hypothetical protein